ncbi:MAG TPA: hypothetical protein VGB62_05950 [Allosphingosinicella sp.]|jgi:hypothetical protein
MRDEMDGRLWAEHHQQFSDDLGKLFDGIAAGLKRLHQMQWSAPWRRDAGHRAGRPGHA